MEKVVIASSTDGPCGIVGFMSAGNHRREGEGGGWGRVGVLYRFRCARKARRRAQRKKGFPAAAALSKNSSAFAVTHLARDTKREAQPVA